MWQQALADASLVSGIAFAARWRNINFWLFSRRQVLLLSLVHPKPLSVVNYTSMFCSLLDPVSLQMWQQALADASFVSAIAIFSPHKVLLFSLALHDHLFDDDHSLIHFLA